MSVVLNESLMFLVDLFNTVSHMTKKQILKINKLKIGDIWHLCLKN